MYLRCDHLQCDQLLTTQALQASIFGAPIDNDTKLQIHQTLQIGTLRSLPDI
jgi:hypothetical protein